MDHKTAIRIILDIVILIAILNGWWLLAVPVGLVGLWFFSFFIEIIVAGILYDSLFGYVRGMGWWGYGGTVASVLLLLMVVGLKRVVRK